MKLNVLLKFFLFFCTLLLTNTVNAQNTKITVANNLISVKQLIAEIEKQTDYLVLLRNNDVDVNRTVQLREKSADISVLLNEAFRNTEVSYDIQNKYIVLTAKQQTTSGQPSDGKKISGTVFDEAGEAVIGASVSVKGSNIGTATDVDGKFSLTVSDPKAVLIVSYLGYKPQEVSLMGGGYSQFPSR